MNNQDKNNINSTDIKNVKELGRSISATEAILMALMSLLLCAFLPVSLFYNMQELLLEGVSVAAIGISILSLYRMVGKKRPFIPATITAVAAAFLIGASVTALIFSFIISICLITHVILFSDSTASKVMCAVSSAAAYLIGAILTGGFAVSTVAFLPLVAALALSFAMSRNLHKVSAICHMSAAMLILIFGVVVIRYVALHGTDLSIAKESIEAFRETLIDMTSKMLVAVSDELPEIAKISATDAKEAATLSVNEIFNLLPAIIITVSNIAAFFIHSMMMSTLFAEKAPSPTLRNMMLFDMSLISAIVFVGMSILGLILSGSEISVWFVTAENVVFILLPGMVLTSIMALKGLTATKAGCAPSLMYFGVVFALLYIPSVMLPLAAVAGAVIIILNSIAKHKLQK